MFSSSKFIDCRNIDFGHSRVNRLTIIFGILLLVIYSVKCSSHLSFNLFRLFRDLLLFVDFWELLEFCDVS